MDQPVVPRQYALVRFQFELLPAEDHGLYPFTPGEAYVFFGDIPNMPGHCVVADHKSGRLFSGYHTEWFAELSEEDA